MDVQRFLLDVQHERGWDDSTTRDVLCQFLESLKGRGIVPGVGGRLVGWLQERFDSEAPTTILNRKEPAPGED